MIKFKKLSWSDAFSYGESNSIELDQSPLTQLIGKNGNGKSSIALILEEVLFNTNSKKIKKGDILNRYTKSKTYVIDLLFDVDGRSYSISTSRNSTSGTVKLMCNGIDISSHTSTGTYKQIEQILGFDHKTFSQIIYQSSVASLEFLTATDTARKKFLIELLNLSVYTKACDLFKEQASAVSKQVDAYSVKAATIKSWLQKYAKEDLSVKELEEELASPVSLSSRVVELKADLANIEKTNKLVTQNNTYKAVLNKLTIPDKPNVPEDTSSSIEYQSEINDINKALAEGRSLHGTTLLLTCKTCSQSIDNTTKFKLMQKFEETKASKEARVLELQGLLKSYQVSIKLYDKYKADLLEYEKYKHLYNPELQSELMDADTLKSDISSLEASIKSINTSIDNTRAENKLAEAHNAKVSVISAQLVEMETDLKAINNLLIASTKELSTLQVLVKAFSTNGLVAYKVEGLVKDLEELTNEYLSVIAEGRFQLSFKIASSDKLNVVITDNGRDIDILALSSGERARVNVSTLLAIRKLMQSLSNSRTNLLILDETVENLDAEGKEKLVEVLLAEENLNTFLISHGFSHPLLEKINIVKENNISRIES